MSFEDEIYTAIDQTIQTRIEKMKLSQQMNGVVMGESKKGEHRYKVKINGEIYDVRDGIGLSPAPNTSVWVCVPKNDWSLAYICAGRNASTGYVTEEEINSVRAALESEIQDVYDACVSGGAVINSTNIGKVLAPEDNVTITENNNKLYIGTTCVSDVTVDGSSVVHNGVAALQSNNLGKIKDVKVDGVSVVNSQGIANIPGYTPITIPVTDVQVNGSSVMDGTIAKIDIAHGGTIVDVKVNGYSVVNSQGVANVPVPSIPVTDVQVDGSSILSGTVAQLSSSDFGTHVEGNPSETATGNLTKIKIDNTVYSVPNGGSGGSTVSVTPILTEGTKIATIGVDQYSYDLYAPTQGGSGEVEDVYVNGASVLDENNIARIDLTGYQTSLQSEIDRIYDVCVNLGSTPPSHGFADVLITAMYMIGSGTKYVETESTMNANMRYFADAKKGE